MDVNRAALGFRTDFAVGCAMEKKGRVQAGPANRLRQAWPASFQRDSGHRINRARQSRVLRGLQPDGQLGKGGWSGGRDQNRISVESRLPKMHIEK